MTTALDCLKELSTTLRSYGIEDTGKESELILTACLATHNSIDRLLLYRDNPLLSEAQEKEIACILERRAQREPIQYIAGQADFYGLKIKVGQGVLVPRPETELLVEEAIKAVSSQQSAVSFLGRQSAISLLDLCTGSGCIALAIARELPDAVVYGTDISSKALAYAGENARINNISNITFLRGDLFGPVKGMKFDIIVSNPPYIRRAEINGLQPEIREWEPLEALDGGEDGLQYYRDIFSHCKEHLEYNGSVIVEIGDKQADDVISLAVGSGLRCEAVIKDYAGIKRVLSFFLRL